MAFRNILPEMHWLVESQSVSWYVHYAWQSRKKPQMELVQIFLWKREKLNNYMATDAKHY